MSQIPDVNRELAEVGAMFSVIDAIRRTRERLWIELLWLAPLEDHPPKRTVDLGSVETEE